MMKVDLTEARAMLTATELQARQKRAAYHEGAEIKGATLTCQARALRKLYGLTLATVAAELGIPVPTLSCIERGASLTLERAFKIAKFWKKPVEEIWQPR